jgi:hypothetical protein
MVAILNMELEDCLAHPTYVGASLMQVGLKAKLQAHGFCA